MSFEQELAKRFENDSGHGQPLSRDARHRKRTIEAYLKAGFVPRYMERSRAIDAATAGHTRRLRDAYERLAKECGEDRGEFSRRWRAMAARWRFDELNDLIREHNDWYPVETGLPLDPRTRDYVRIRGRSYRRRELGAEWVLERFPP